MNGMLCESIKRRCLLEVEYSGGVRVIEPYAHGLSRDGMEILVAFQRGGASSSGRTIGWKAFRADELDQVVVLDVTFLVNRTEYRAGGLSKNLVSVHCCV